MENLNDLRRSLATVIERLNLELNSIERRLTALEKQEAENGK